MKIQQTVKHWHTLIEKNQPELLNLLLADDAVFHSPVLHTPQKGKALTKMYLSAAMHVFDGNGFHYKKEILQGNYAALEFEAEIDGVIINGVDIITCNDKSQVTEFKVMIRPAKGLQKLQEKMLALLQGKQK